MGILKKLVIVLVIILAVVGALTYFTLFYDPNNSTTLIVAAGKANVNGLDFLSGEYEIESGDTITTFEGSDCQIITPDNNIVFLEENTEIVFSDDSDVTNIKVNKGSIWNKVVSLFGKEYNAEGNYVVATVRGTAFGVGTGNKDEIFVGEGEVDADGEKVGEGEQLDADANGKKKVPMSEENKAKIKKYLAKQFKSYNLIVNKRLTRNKLMKAIVDANVDDASRKEGVKDFLTGDLDKGSLEKYDYLMSSKDEKLIEEIESDRERALKYYTKEELRNLI